MELPRLVRAALWPLSLIYGAVVKARATFYARGVFKQKRLNAAVISVGNLTVGGTGKTPMVLWLAERFLAEGKRVAILSRGYRGANGTSDEIELLKHRLAGRVIFGVGPNRYREGRRIATQQAVDLFILDDGFQHLSLGRDVNILMLDGSRKLKNEWLLPAGNLREPVGACSRANLLVVTRKTERPDIEAADSHKFSIFYARTRLLGFRPVTDPVTSPVTTKAVPSYLSEIGPGPFFAFCAIGNPSAFVDDLAKWHVALVGQSSFRDHHRYTQKDAQNLEQAAEKAGATALITTEKDEQNLANVKFQKLPVYVAVIDFVLASESEFLGALDRCLAARSGAAA